MQRRSISLNLFYLIRLPQCSRVCSLTMSLSDFHPFSHYQEMKGSFPSALKSHCAAIRQPSPSCLVSFSVISLPGQENVQMFIHQPPCVEVSPSFPDNCLMFLCGSRSNTAETQGCSHSAQGKPRRRNTKDQSIMQMSFCSLSSKCSFSSDFRSLWIGVELLLEITASLTVELQRMISF